MFPLIPHTVFCLWARMKRISNSRTIFQYWNVGLLLIMVFFQHSNDMTSWDVMLSHASCCNLDNVKAVIWWLCLGEKPSERNLPFQKRPLLLHIRLLSILNLNFQESPLWCSREPSRCGDPQTYPYVSGQHHCKKWLVGNCHWYLSRIEMVCNWTLDIHAMFDHCNCCCLLIK